jgi:hypothetical protein
MTAALYISTFIIWLTGARQQALCSPYSTTEFEILFLHMHDNIQSTYPAVHKRVLQETSAIYCFLSLALFRPTIKMKK